jgi:HAD superfamily hydrolase (TIGR01509 family)
MPAKSKSVVKVLKEFFDIDYDSQEFISKFAGGKIDLSVKEILLERQKEFTEELVQMAVQEREELVNRDLIKGNMPLIPGAKELIVELEKEGCLLGIASGSRQEFIQNLLKIHQIDSYFQSVVSAFDNEVKKPKPAPDIFLKCSNNLGVLPKHCLVIEDGKLGMQAAKKAGMKCVALVKKTSSEYDFVDLQVTDLRKLNLKKVFEVIGK